MTDVGALFRTGQVAPVSGVYRFIESVDAECEPTPEAMKIPLSKGERFPPHRRCKGAVIWELTERA
ncbi:YjzC family protein [Actinopolymorpha sp. NPDC004070]|uniref:YjzC family protein n=1 Tax=Actinopolymorpha sp. NPDC004070 TaxID=3154548 RepID=UPI00339DFFB8